MPILGLCRAGSRLYTFGVVPPCSAGPIATVAPAHRGWFVANPDTRFGVTSGWPVTRSEPFPQAISERAAGRDCGQHLSKTPPRACIVLPPG
jgi:hypothetical protein